MAAAKTTTTAASILRRNPFLLVIASALVLFMKLEYTIPMVPPGSEPRDLGFKTTEWLHRLLADRPLLNSALAALNTLFVAFQAVYVAWTFFVDKRKRPTIAFLIMYTIRAFCGYVTQLPVPQEFLGSGLDFPVGNTSFFLFFSGHVAGSVIIAIDLRRMRRMRFAMVVDILNAAQVLRLLATRGHYTIDLIVGVGAGWACDILSGKYDEGKTQLEMVIGGTLKDDASYVMKDLAEPLFTAEPGFR